MLDTEQLLEEKETQKPTPSYACLYAVRQYKKNVVEVVQSIESWLL